MEASEADRERDLRDVQPVVTLQVITDFERETGLLMLLPSDQSRALRSVDTSLTLLHMACRHQYPRLSREALREGLSVEEFGAACYKLHRSLADFFGQYGAGFPRPDPEEEEK